MSAVLSTTIAIAPVPGADVAEARPGDALTPIQTTDLRATAEVGDASVFEAPPFTIPIRATLDVSYSDPAVAAGQGVFVHPDHPDRLYLYGDADTGVIREYELLLDAGPALPRATGVQAARGQLIPAFTGREIRLTRRGEDLLPHPTGLTHHPRYGTFIGDTVRQQGVIWHIDWNRALADGDLDHAVLNRSVDDRAVNGTRPEFVRYGNRWLIATCDYGDQGNTLRLYDPQRLAAAARTSSEGVLVAQWPCATFVQTLHWIDEMSVLVLVQNRTPGRWFRLTPVRLGQSDDLRHYAPFDFPQPMDELEGFAMLPIGLRRPNDGMNDAMAPGSLAGHAVYFTAHREHNIRFGRFAIDPR